MRATTMAASCCHSGLRARGRPGDEHHHKKGMPISRIPGDGTALAATPLRRQRLDEPVVELHPLVERLDAHPLVAAMGAHVVYVDEYAGDPESGDARRPELVAV